MMTHKKKKKKKNEKKKKNCDPRFARLYSLFVGKIFCFFAQRAEFEALECDRLKRSKNKIVVWKYAY